LTCGPFRRQSRENFASGSLSPDFDGHLQFSLTVRECLLKPGLGPRGTIFGRHGKRQWPWAFTVLSYSPEKSAAIKKGPVPAASRRRAPRNRNCDAGKRPRNRRDDFGMTLGSYCRFVGCLPALRNKFDAPAAGQPAAPNASRACREIPANPGSTPMSAPRGKWRRSRDRRGGPAPSLE